MREKRIGQFNGPVGLYAEFDYAMSETRITLFEMSAERYKSTRCDLDNLIKEIAEACQDSGVLKDDAQIALIEAKKLK